MFELKSGFNILFENAKTFKQRNEINSLTESEKLAVSNTLVSNLYQSILNKDHIDFDNIPESKGDIFKYEGYKYMVEILSTIEKLMLKTPSKIDEVKTVIEALSNIANNKKIFEAGFKLEKEFIMLQYNLLVFACVEATSCLVASYVEFMKSPDQGEYIVIKNEKHPACLCIKNLEMFNKTIKNGDFSRVTNSILKYEEENFIGSESIAIPALIVSSVLFIVPIMRELIFIFYNSRMKVSDYLKHQALLLEINELSLQSSNKSPSEREKIIKKQKAMIKKLNTMSDKIRIEEKTNKNRVEKGLSKENKEFTIGNIKNQEAFGDTNQGLTLQ